MIWFMKTGYCLKGRTNGNVCGACISVVQREELILVTAISMADFVLIIFVGSAQSFLGLSVQPPNPEPGLTVDGTREFFLLDWRLITYPCLAVVITGAAFRLIRDGLAQTTFDEIVDAASS